MSGYSLPAILISLISIYTGYYFCRTNLAVALPSILQATHTSKSGFGVVISYGYLSYALGKLLNGTLVDTYGSKRVLVGCLLGSVCCTLVLSTFNDVPFAYVGFGWLWSFNRYFQSGGWPALITLIKCIYPSHQHGNAIGLASLSYSLGDAFIRLVLGELLSLGFSWQAIFAVSAFCAIVLMIPAIFIVHTPTTPMTSTSPGHTSPPTSSSPSSSTPTSTSRCRTFAFPTMPRMTRRQHYQYLVLVLQSPIFVWTREVFQTWSPVFLHDTFSISPGFAALLTVLFPLLGALSSVLGGYWIDRCTSSHRGKYYVMFIFLSVLCIASVPYLTSLTMMVSVLSGFFLLFSAPMIWADGVFPLLLVQGPYTGRLIGVLHCTGYLGAMLSGAPIGWLIETSGWNRVFQIMTGWIVVNGVLAIGFWMLDDPLFFFSSRTSSSYQRIGRYFFSGLETKDEGEEALNPHETSYGHGHRNDEREFDEEEGGGGGEENEHEAEIQKVETLGVTEKEGEEEEDDHEALEKGRRRSRSKREKEGLLEELEGNKEIG